MPSVIVLESEVWEGAESWGWSPHGWDESLYKRGPRVLFFFFQEKLQWKDGPRGLSPDTKSVSYHHLALLSLQNYEKQVCFICATLSMVFLLGQPEWTLCLQVFLVPFTAVISAGYGVPPLCSWDTLERRKPLCWILSRDFWPLTRASLEVLPLLYPENHPSPPLVPQQNFDILHQCYILPLLWNW